MYNVCVRAEKSIKSYAVSLNLFLFFFETGGGGDWQAMTMSHTWPVVFIYFFLSGYAAKNIFFILWLIGTGYIKLNPQL